MKLGDSIKQLRKQRNLTQKSLATLVGISINALNSIENNRSYPSKDTLFKLSKALNYTIPAIIINCLDINDIPKNKEPLLLIINILRKEFDLIC